MTMRYQRDDLALCGLSLYGESLLKFTSSSPSTTHVATSIVPLPMSVPSILQLFRGLAHRRTGLVERYEGVVSSCRSSEPIATMFCTVTTTGPLTVGVGSGFVSVALVMSTVATIVPTTVTANTVGTSQRDFV